MPKTNKPQPPPTKQEQYFLERPLPSSEEAERTIIGGILVVNVLAAQALQSLQPEDFHSPLHRLIFDSIKSLHRRSEAIDAVTILNELKKEKHSIDITVISGMVFGLPHFSDLSAHIKIVKEKSLARQMIKINSDMIAKLLAEDEPIDTTLANQTSTLIALQGRTTMNQTEPLAATVKEVRETFRDWERNDLEKSQMRTGLTRLDAKLRLRGLAGGELTLIAARPSMGKTALLIQIASHVARLGFPVLFISLEMLRSRIVMRMLAPIAAVQNKAINPTTIRSLPEERNKLYSALDHIENLPIYFNRSFDLPQQIATIEYYVQTKGIKLVAFDYLQMITDSGMSKYANRDQEIGKIIRELKEVAVRTNTASLGAAQLSRQNEKEHRRPRLSDLRDSGNIEQAADVVLFPWDANAKEHERDPDMIADKIDLELYCAKQRDGERYWTVHTYYDKNMQMFEDFDEPVQPAYKDFYETETSRQENFSIDPDKDDNPVF